MAKPSLPKNLSTDNLTVAVLPSNPRFINRTGQRFGRLVALRYAGKYRNRASAWVCQCDCGSTVTIVGNRLHNGTSQSCGCLARDLLRERITTHGETRNGNVSVEYEAYTSAKRRCGSQSCADFADYGGRGIEFRFDSFAQFLATLGRKPSAKHSLDRINNNGHYEPGNVRWATKSQQMQNRRSVRLVNVQGVVKCIADWSRQTGNRQSTIQQRMKYGWCEPCAVSLPAKSTCIHKQKR